MKQYHTKENLAKSVAIEAGELLELSQWGENPSGDELRRIGTHLNDEHRKVFSRLYLIKDDTRPVSLWWMTAHGDPEPGSRW